ncbi:acyl-CoA dehydrogenase [Candidatus Phycosocius bacilliformis]|uniref:Acyl-CoA dehydrogenase n=1 Tax=Candidatus Phycosocius bacilliformis TaxID=1445552 RepID=A0A2P2ECQ6_9PROT|nr:acyl-CoA dehydrogenase family protein [Candidatus Phycosocius bacilliformis]GBF58831.1 acyl-CoA dehydrogenase [Candidatus Phycosocius bacilliformis]
MPDSLDFDGLRPRSPFVGESHALWRTQLRRFIDREIMPYAQDWDEAGAIPRELFLKAGEFGLLGAGFPVEYGGSGRGPDYDWHHGIITSEELGRVGAGGVTAALMIHGIGLPPILASGSEETKARIAPDVLAGRQQISLAITEPDAGSDVANLQTRAERIGDHYRVNGAKLYITGGCTSHWLTTAVRTGGPGAGGISLLLIDANAKGVTRRNLAKQGWWASDTAEIFFEDVDVPVEHLIGPENGGFFGIMANFNGERLGMTAGALSAARACVEDAVAWARQRKTFGKRLADHQVIRHKIARMSQAIAASTTWLDQCAWRVSQGETPVADLCMLKVQATETLEMCAREASQILGGASYMRGSRIERIYREVRVNAIGGGSEEIMRDLAARQLGL